MITGIDFVAVPAQDLDRAITFYRDTLGLTPGENEPGVYTEFDLPDGNTLTLLDRRAWLDPSQPDRQPVTAGSFVLGVSDLDALLQTLRAAGLTEQEAPFDAPSCNGVFARDPEGNAFALHRRKVNPGVDKGLDFVALPVADMARAKAFYAEMFGLTPGEFDSEAFVEYDLPGGNTLALGDTTAMGVAFEPVTGGSLALAVDDVFATFARFKERGLAEVPEAFETPVCYMGLVKDSEGNRLILHRHK